MVNAPCLANWMNRRIFSFAARPDQNASGERSPRGPMPMIPVPGMTSVSPYGGCIGSTSLSASRARSKASAKLLASSAETSPHPTYRKSSASGNSLFAGRQPCRSANSTSLGNATMLNRKYRPVSAYPSHIACIALIGSNGKRLTAFRMMRPNRFCCSSSESAGNALLSKSYPIFVSSKKPCPPADGQGMPSRLAVSRRESPTPAGCVAPRNPGSSCRS